MKTTDLSPAGSISSAFPMLRSEEDLLWGRTGLPGWWLNLTAPPRPPRGAPIAEIQRVWKAELTSWSILGVFMLSVALTSNAIMNASTADAIGFAAIGLTVAAILNRTGRTRAAAYLVPSIVMSALILGDLHEGIIREMVFPIWDLFSVPVVISGFIADRRAPWIFVTIAIAFVIGNYSLTPHEVIHGFDQLTYDQNRLGGWWGMIDREVAIILFAAFFSWVGARSFEKALRRVDRSNEVATLEATLRRKEEERAEIVEAFVKEVMGAIAAQSNGQNKYLEVRLPTDQIAPYIPFINNHLNRIRQLVERLRHYQHLWSHDKLARAVDALTQHANEISQGYLPIRALMPNNLPEEARGLEELANVFYGLLLQAMTEASKSNMGRGRNSLIRTLDTDGEARPGGA